MQSRLQILQIPIFTDEKIRIVMERIIRKENLLIDEESKDHLITLSCGNIRILIQYLEKIYIIGEPITIEKCRLVFSIISYHNFECYLEFLKKGDLYNAVHTIYTIYEEGYSVIDILDFFFAFLKKTKSLEEITKYKIIPFICKYITIFHKNHEDPIELVLFTNNLAKVIHDDEN
jgi:DNA polymerase III gamma/tau subunit